MVRSLVVFATGSRLTVADLACNGGAVVFEPHSDALARAEGGDRWGDDRDGTADGRPSRATSRTADRATASGGGLACHWNFADVSRLTADGAIDTS